MTVLAECSDCEVTQPLGARIAPPDGFQSATVCPECGSQSYSTRCTEVFDSHAASKTFEDSRSESEKEGLSAREIRRVLKTVDGVGVGTLENIESSVGNLTRLKAVETTELTSIDGVGATTAERIVGALG